ncbi:MAG: LptF/LptG family permease [Rhodospirillales bacterium]|nr:LptF/LptG family permease [Rhodospirillales bacterium]
MTEITRYIAKQLLIGTFLVALGLSAILWLTQSLRFVELIINKGLSIGAFGMLTMLLLPNFLTIITPVAVFAVLLFTYNRLDADREIVVMRSAGLSHLALARPALTVGLVLVVFGYILNLVVIPSSVKTFREMQWSIRNDLSRVMLQEGSFNQITDGLTVYVRSRGGDGELLDVLVHDMRPQLKERAKGKDGKPESEKVITMMAERGALVKGEGNRPRVLLINGNRQELFPESGRLSLLYFDSYTVEMAGADEAAEPRFRDARERPIQELLSVTVAEVGAVDFARFRVEAHQRLSAPLYHLAFIAIGLACLLIGGFSRHGQTGRVILAIGLMVATEAAQLGVGGLAVKSLRLVPLIYAVPLLPVAIGLYVLARPPVRRSRGRIVEAAA